MKYFLHDSNAFQDEKIGMLFDQHGFEGLGLFYTILEKLAYQEKPINTNVLKRQLHVGKKLKKCWEFLEEIELISSNNGETFNENILKFSEKFSIRSEKNRKRISQWRENQAIANNVTRTENVRNALKDKISKENRSKENVLLEKEPKGGLFFKDEISIGLKAESEKPKEKSSAKKEKVSIDFGNFDTPEFRAKWEDFKAYRRKIKAPIVTIDSEQRIFDKVTQYDARFIIEQINATIDSGKWQGIIFDNTPQKYKDWQAGKGKTSQPEAEIIPPKDTPEYYAYLRKIYAVPTA